MGIITMIPHSRHRVNRPSPVPYPGNASPGQCQTSSASRLTAASSLFPPPFPAVLVFVYHHVSFLSIGNRCSGPGGVTV